MARKSRTNIYLLGGVFLLLLLYVLLVEVPSALREGQRTAKRVFADLQADQITALSLTGNPTIRLERKQEQWQITAPKQYPADQTTVQGLIQDLLALEVTRTLPARSEKLQEYGLRPATNRLVVEAGPKKQTLVFGGQNLILAQGKRSAFVYTMLLGSDKVYLLEALKTSKLNPGLKNLRYKKVFSFSVAQVTRVQWDYQGKKMGLNKDKGVWYLQHGKREQAASTKVEAFLADFASFEVNEFLTDRGVGAAYGIRPDRNYIRVTTPEGTQTLYFGREKTGMRACMVSGSPAVYECLSYKFERLSKPAKELLPSQNKQPPAGPRAYGTNQAASGRP